LNRKGVTLIELLVYVVLFAIISVLIGTQMKHMVKGFASGRRISRMQSDSRDVLSMLSREIKNTGLKTYLTNAAGGGLQKTTVSKAYLTDSSSFIAKQGNPGDTLIIYKALFDNAGALSGVDTIEYFLNGTTLMRKKSGAVLNIVENVYALQFQYGVFSVDSLYIIDNPTASGNWSVNGSAASTYSNLKLTVTGATSGRLNCTKQFNIASPQNVWIKFKLIPTGGFPANLSQIRCVVRTSSNEFASDTFLARNEEVRLKLTVPAVSNAFVAFNYTSTGSGAFDIQSLEVRRADLGRYVWYDSPVTNNKKAVKAINVFALVRSSDKVETAEGSSITVANISVARSGAYAWRLYKETIEILNNGIF
jgi:hypothetical protein